MSESRRVIRSLGVAAVGLASLGYGLMEVWPFSVDDAGIVYAYAKHLAAGQGFRAVVGGPIVEGYSDFLWMMLVALATKLGFATPLAAKVLGSALLVWSAIAAACFVGIASNRVAVAGATRWAQVLPAVIMGLCPEFVVWAPSGLENGLYSAALLTSLWFDLREAERPTLMPWSALGAACIALTRPEGIIYVAVILAAKVSDARRDRAYGRQCGLFFTLLLVPLLAYHAWHYAEFRELVPNTYFAKARGSGGWWNGVAYVRNGLIDSSAQWLVPLSLVGLFAGLRRTLPALGAAAMALAFAFYARGDWMPHYRFVSFALPSIAILAAVGSTVVSSFLGKVAKRDDLTNIALLGTVLGVSGLWFLHHRVRFHTTQRIRWCHFCSRLEDAANHQAERKRLGLHESTLLTHDFGGPSYASTPAFLPLDLLGLADQSAALIAYRREQDGFARADFARLQYFFHEQPQYPTFVFLPDNFTNAFRNTPEFRWGYVDVKIPPRGNGRVIAPTRLHRGAFVNFFPQVEGFKFEPIGSQLRFVGASGWSNATAPNELDVDVSVTELEKSASPVLLGLRVDGVRGPTIPLFEGDPSLAFGTDEPVSARLHISKPETANASDLVELGVQIAGASPVWVPLFPLSRVRPARERSAALPFPNNLPGTSDPTLNELGRRVRALIDQQRTRGDLTLHDTNLGKALVSSGATAEARGDRSDAYLAYVWATQVDPDQVRFLYRKIGALRPERQRSGFLMERALLGQFYESGDEFWQLELARSYVRERLWDKARFFLDRLPGNHLDDIWTQEAIRLRAQAAAAGRTSSESPGDSRFLPGPVPGVASDFETPLNGWTLGEGAFAAVAETSDRRPVWGTHGARYFSSESAGPEGGRAVGTAQSSDFVVAGRALSFVIAGGDTKGLSAELVVSGNVVQSAAPPGSRCFFPVFWDLTPYRGKRAHVRLVDQSTDTDAFIAVDDFEVWPQLQSESAVPAPP